MRRKKRIVLRIVWQSGLVLFLSLSIALIVNRLRPGGLSLEVGCSMQTQLEDEASKGMVISIQEAREAFFLKRAIFLDARPEELYVEGHIQGARNLPAEAVDKLFATTMADISRDAMIITYCDGEGCSLSKDLAKELFFRGYENVHVLVNGWTRWIEAGLPVAEGRNGYLGG